MLVLTKRKRVLKLKQVKCVIQEILMGELTKVTVNISKQLKFGGLSSKNWDIKFGD